MKAESTIRKQIRRLRAISEDDVNYSRETRNQAYEAWHALRWVLESVSWTPAGELGTYSIDPEKPREK